jgi:glycosyltransferase involved in cell wall biosynthesis
MHGQPRRPHLVYLAIGFPPAAKSSAYRMRATANIFVSLGWDVTVVTIARDSWLLEYGLDLTLLDLVDPRVRIVELPLRRRDLDPDISSYGRLRARYPGYWLKLRRRLDTLPFPEQVFGPWRHGLESGLAGVLREQPGDLVLVSPAPYTGLAAAWHAHRTFGVPYAIDYRDGWSVDVLGDGAAFGRWTRRGRWEGRLIGHARAVLTVNEPIAQFYRERYPTLADRFRVARNGFDADLGEDLAVTRPPDVARGLTFGYLGTVNLQPGHLSAIIDGWRRARDRSELLARSRLVFRGHIGAGFAAGANSNAALITAAAADDVQYGGPVAKADVAATYRSWDALVLALAGGRYVTSGKVFEYMATGLPIISAHVTPHAAQDVLAGYPLWVRPERLAAEQLCQGFLDGARLAVQATDEQRRAAHRHADQFERVAQLRPELARLAESVAGRNASEVSR